MSIFTDEELEKIQVQRKALADLWNRVQSGEVMFIGTGADQLIADFEKSLLALQETDKGFLLPNDYVDAHNAALEAGREVARLYEEGRYIDLKQ